MADGSGEEVLMAKAGVGDFVNSVSPDGKALLFGYGDIMKLPLTAEPSKGEARPEPYLKTNYDERWAAFSPDGRWVAYQSNESGRYEIYIQGYPDKRGKLLVSASGGQYPQWRRDGREIYWAQPDGTMTAASIELSADSVRPGKPQALFRIPEAGRMAYYSQPSRDGQRFLVYEPESGQQPDLPMVVIQNWAARLEK